MKSITGSAQKTNSIVSLVLLALLVFSLPIVAQTIYVDHQLTADCVGNYSIANRDCSGTDGDAYVTFASASSAATASMTVLIRAGSYSEQLSPQHAGSVGSYITFKNYGNEVVEITGATLEPAIWIENKDYIAIEGLQIRDVDRWLNALGCDYLVLKNNVFERALDSGRSSKTGVFLQACNYAIIQDNTLFDTTQDNLGLVNCDYNLIEGNTITKAYHTLWALKCSNFNIIRDNYFHNEIQKIGEIYDCDNAGFGSAEFPKLDSYDDAKHNVVEGNVFAYTASPVDKSPYSGIQYAAQNGLIRNNIFYECEGPPISLSLYSDEAKYNYSNRIAHNVFYDNEFGGIDISGSTNHTFSDQEFKNNIFYKNKFVQRDSRWSWYDELDQKAVQIKTGRIDEIFFDNNNIFNNQADDLYIIAYGLRNSSSNPGPESLTWWQTNHPTVFANNLQVEPNFVDVSTYDFHLQSNSPMIDAGAFLTKATISGTNSTALQVDDAAWFIDGFGITAGDVIQIEGQTTQVSITAIDYGTGTLTLDAPLSWDSGDGVSSAFNNTQPDLGAFESQIPLTVDYLLPLQAVARDNQVFLKWVSANERDNDYFQVERSQNTSDWKSIGRIAGAGNSSLSSVYQAIDSSPPTGNLYYRLKQIDFDGTGSYSNIASVLLEKQDFLIYPNPTTGVISISNEFLNKEYLIYSSMAVLVKKGRISTGEIDVSGLVSGFYHIEIVGEGSKQTAVFQVLRE